MKNKRVNYNFIEPLWRTGGLSNYEISRQYELMHKDSDKWKKTVTEGAIRKRARAKGWKKDLVAKVQKRTAEKLVRTEVREGHARARVNDDDIIEEAAKTRVRVTQLQRADLEELRTLEEDLVRRFRNDECETVIEWHEGVAIEHQVKMGYLKRVRAYREFVIARTKRIAMERVVWGLYERGKGTGDDNPTQINFKMYLGDERS